MNTARSVRWALVGVLGAAVVLLLGAPAAMAQTDTEPPTTVDLAPFDEPFSRGYFLIHLTGTDTMSGHVEKDTYIIHTEAPVDGFFLTADGSGGTFNNYGDLVAGDLMTPAAVCAAASGLDIQSYDIEGRFFDCAVLTAVPESGGGTDDGDGTGAGPAAVNTAIAVVGGAAAVAAAAAAASVTDRKGRTSKVAILQVDRNAVEVDASTPATITLTGWATDEAGSLQRAPMSIALEVPPDSGLSVSPTSGSGEMVVTIAVEDPGAEGDVTLIATGTLGGKTATESITVSIAGDLELRLY